MPEVVQSGPTVSFLCLHRRRRIIPPNFRRVRRTKCVSPFSFFSTCPEDTPHVSLSITCLLLFPAPSHTPRGCAAPPASPPPRRRNLHATVAPWRHRRP